MDSQLNFYSSLVKGSPISEREKNIILSNLDLSNREIADKIFRTQASIRKFLNCEGIHRSKFQLAQIRKRVAENQQGGKNPNWKNGISKNHYHYKKSRAIKDRIKNICRNRVYRAIQNGTLISQPCNVCGSAENIEAHHWSYEIEKALQVEWLCKKHHILADQQRRAMETNFTQNRYESVPMDSEIVNN